jgi:1-acyl-sn-glycerol-3-phosphate acyltransferase
MGDVIELRRRDRPGPAAVEPLPAPAWDVDDWGRDEVLARAARKLTRLRWDTACGGLSHIPPSGPALLVVNTQRFNLTPWWVALVLSEELRRPVRFVGRSDSAPLGAFARRLGGLLARPDDVGGALGAGQLVLGGLTGTIDTKRTGRCDPELLAPAIELGVPVFPTAAAASDVWRTARIDVATAIGPRRPPGDLTPEQLAHRVEEEIDALLASFGVARLGLPLHWLLRPSGDC